MPCSCDARDVVVPQVKSTAWPARGLSGFHAGARTVPFVSALILTSVWVSQHVFFRVLVPCAPVLLCSSDPPVVRAAAQTCVPRLDTSPAGQARPGVPPWPSCSSCCSAAGPAGGSAPRDPTYSTAQEQQTGISTRPGDQNAVYVCMGDSQPKHSIRGAPQPLEHGRVQVWAGFPPPPEITVLEAAPVLLPAFWRPEQRCMGTLDAPAYHGLVAGGKILQVVHPQKV